MANYKGNISLQEIKEKILKAQNIVLTTHINPDGDALGSVLALLLILNEYNKHYIEKIYNFKTVRIVIDDDLPKYMSKFPESLAIEKLNHFEMKEIDLLISLDCANVERIGNVATLKEKAKETINIDHHISNTEHAKFNYISETASTAEIIYEFLDLFGVNVDKKIAEYIYLGIINDTGNFSHDNVTKETFEICADLMKTGLNNNKIVNSLYSMSMNKVNLYADVYSKKIIDNELNYIYYYLPYKKMQELKMTKDETDGIAENLLTIEGIDISMFVREEEDGSKKGSLRCNSKYNVNEIAQLFNGGGHIKAAGFKTNLEFDDIVKKIEEQLLITKQ